MFTILNQTSLGAQVIHPRRAFVIRGSFERDGEIHEATGIEQVEFFSVYAYEGNKLEGDAWHMHDLATMSEAIAYVRGFVRGMGQ